MIQITKNGNVSVILFTDSDFYLFNSGQIIVPLGSLTMVVDKSDMATFRKSSNNDLLFSAKISKVTINGTQLTKDNAQTLFDEALGSGGSGGGSSIRFVEVQQLPQTGENDIIYLVPNGDDTFTEWVWLEDEERFEKLGYDVDLSDYYTKTQVDTALANKQNTLTFDSAPTHNSTNPVTSGGVYTALQNVQPDLSNYYDKDEIDDAHLTISAALNELHDEKQDLLNFDNSPTQNSTNPVTSGGVYDALQNVQPDLSNYYTKTQVDTALTAKQNTLTFDNTPTENSTNPVTSGGIYTALQNVQPDMNNYYDKDEIDEGNRVVSTALNRLNSALGDIDTALATIIGSNS